MGPRRSSFRYLTPAPVVRSSVRRSRGAARAPVASREVVVRDAERRAISAGAARVGARMSGI